VKHHNLDTDPPDSAATAEEVLAHIIGSDAASTVRGLLSCARCQEPCAAGSRCQVPHPVHLREDMGGSFNPNGEAHSRFCCGACKQHFTFVSISGSEERVDGPAWCFEGRHAPTRERDLY
jgi:hypothetical protein